MASGVMPSMAPAARPPVSSGRSEEAALVERAQAGDASAFAALVRRYERSVYSIARQITQNAHDAEDVLQDTFLSAYQHLKEFHGSSRFHTWLIRIAINQALMKLRRQKNDAVASLDDTFDTGDDSVPRQVAAWDPNPEQRYSREELRAVLDAAIRNLPAPFRAVFVLRDVEEMSEQFTAAALNLRTSAVRTRLFRARMRLREELNRSFK